MIVERVEHPEWLSNAYLVAEGPGGHGVFIDSNGLTETLEERTERHRRHRDPAVGRPLEWRDGLRLREPASAAHAARGLPCGAIPGGGVFHRRPGFAAAAQELEPCDDVNLCAEGPTKICAMLDSASIGHT